MSSNLQSLCARTLNNPVVTIISWFFVLNFGPGYELSKKLWCLAFRDSVKYDPSNKYILGTKTAQPASPKTKVMNWSQNAGHALWGLFDWTHFEANDDEIRCSDSLKVVSFFVGGIGEKPNLVSRSTSSMPVHVVLEVSAVLTISSNSASLSTPSFSRLHLPKSTDCLMMNSTFSFEH